MATLEHTSTILRPRNPATLEPVGAIEVTTSAQLADAVAIGREAQARWSAEPLATRRRLLDRAAATLLADADEIAATIVAETGKPLVEAFTSELFPSLDAARWLQHNLERALRPTRVRLPRLLVPQKRARVHWQPAGLVAIVSAWNFPLGVPLTQTLTAVAAGDAAIVKPSELTPLTGAWIEELFRRAGAPTGLVQVVQGPGDTVGEMLVGHDGVDHVVFTGSTTVGRHVAGRCAELVRPVTLELGGKDPMLVLDDSDVARAVGGALWAAFTNAGQVCSGVERAYVEDAVFDEFVDRLSAAASGLQLGRGDDPATQMGPLISDDQRSRVESLVADAVEQGAEIVSGGGRPDVGLPGWFHEPTVIVGEPAAARIGREEIFGPVLTVVRMENESDGIARANGSSYGLGASVWSRDHARAERIALRLRAGSVWTNDHAYSYGTFVAPWGGVGSSGYGRTHAVDGLRSLSTAKYVDRDAGRLRPPWWYPYSARTVEGFRAAAETAFADGTRSRLAAAVRHRRALANLARSTMRDTRRGR